LDHAQCAKLRGIFGSARKVKRFGDSNPSFKYGRRSKRSVRPFALARKGDGKAGSGVGSSDWIGYADRKGLTVQLVRMLSSRETKSCLINKELFAASGDRKPCTSQER
jgi:hypothetical protein